MKIIMKNRKMIVFIILFTLALWAFLIEPNLLVVKHYKLKDDELKGLKIVFAGDFHIKKWQMGRLKRSVKLINKQNPDMVLSVGDFINGHRLRNTMPAKDIINELKNIKAKYGFFTVLGNHDVWVDKKGVEDALEKNGIKLLENSNAKVKINGKEIYIAGVEDKQTQKPDVYKALDGTKNPVILLTHSPDVFVSVPKSVNLTLAGHVHGGQVRFPFLGATIIPSDYGNRYSQGLIKENEKTMIVTKGIGNSILNVRFLCVPEIVVIEFE